MNFCWNRIKYFMLPEAPNIIKMSLILNVDEVYYTG